MPIRFFVTCLSRRLCLLWAVMTCCFGPLAGLNQAQEVDLQELADDELRQVQIAERFVGVLEKSPRRGTALDRVYGHHVEFGTLDDFIGKLRTRVEQSPDDGAGWMLLGLFESQRGQDANAIDAFLKAEQHRPEDPLASYYLGQSQLLLGQPEAAVQSFERAIERQPQRADLLEIFQQLGRVHQRAQRDDDALRVWTRLESQFPDDPRVQEQIAVTLVEEGKYDLALPRYEQLALSVTDDYRQTMFRLEAAELKVRTAKKDQGIADLEQVLANLNPDSWLHREVRRRIEDIFLRSGDQDGLVKYYEKWIAGHAEDVDAMARVARFLASSARMPEAMQWMEQALRLAPRRFELRKAFIDQLVDDQRYADAIQQYQLLAQADPGNPDVLRDWGKLVLKDKTQSIEQRQAEATRIWNQIVANRPDDALTAAQAADLFRQANFPEPAIALYEKAVSLAPADPQYREYLGEYLHILKRPDDALATWRQIAAGPQHNAVNVARLAEVYQTFGYMDAAVEQIAEACRLEPKDLALQLRGADYHSRAGQYDPALTYVEAAQALAANVEERDAVIAQRIEVLQSAKRLVDESDALAAKLAKAVMPAADDWHLLARYFEVERRWEQASEAIDQALSIDSQSIPAITTAARIAESSGDLGRAADLNRKLADADRRSRGDHLMNVARIEAQLGRTDAALQAGRDLIVSAPGNTDHYEFYAQLCFQLGKLDEGLDNLRKAVRINPSEPSLILALGNALSQQFRTDEAIEVYWRAFEKTEEVEERTALTEKLTDLYLQLNQFDKLVERFERDRFEEDQRRDLTICLAQAHSSAGDNGTARSELESLLSQETRDTNLLQQLSKLCEGGGDFDGAIEYQRQLAAIAPGHETEHRLATLLQRAGESEEAAEIFLMLTRREEDPVRLMRSIDSLLSQGSYESVLAVVEPLLSEQRDDWELLYRQGVAWASLEKPAEAQQSFQRILAVNTPLDAYGRAAEERYKRELAKAKSDSLRGLLSNKPQRQSPLDMLQNSYQIKSACGLEPDRNYYGSSAPSVWMPEIYGVARMAAYGWLLRYEQEASSREKTQQAASVVDPIRERAAAPDARQTEVYDWLFVESLRGNYDSIFQTARRLAESGGTEEQQFFLQSLNLRTTNAESARTSSSSQTKKEPLSEADIDLMLRCYESLNQQAENQGQQNASFAGAQVAYGSNGQMYVNIGGNWVAVSGGVSGGRMFLNQVAEELELAGRAEQAEQLIARVIDDAQSASDLLGAMQLILSRDEKHPDRDALRPLYDRWVAAARGEIHAPPPTSTRRGSRAASSVSDPLSGSYDLLVNWIGLLGPDEEHEQILDIVNPALDLSVEVLKAQRAERSKLRRRPTSRTASQSSAWSIRYQYGRENRSVSIAYPTPGDYASTPQVTMLRATYEVLQRNNVSEDLIANARKRLEAASDDDRMYEQLLLAYLLWWAEQPDDAVELLKSVAEQVSDDPQFKLELAVAQQAQGDLDGALEIVDAIAPRDQKLLQQRELLAMSLAERLGDVDRARQAAERLFGLRLSTDEQLGLATAMRRIGMLELAESIMARVQRQSGQQASSLPLLMVQYLGQGQTELAQQIAHRILRTTQSPLIGQSNSTYNPSRYSRSGNSSGREQALRILQQSGGLQPMIDRLESQLEKSPESLRLYQQLIELYQTKNDREKLAATISKAVLVRPDDVSLQYLLAKHYEQTGKPKEACDAYLSILKLKPRWITDDLYSIRRVFEQAQRTPDLAKAFETMDIKQMGHPYYLIDVVQNLMRDEGQVELGVSLFERIVEAFPSYRSSIISNLNNDENIWRNERIYELGKQLITPTADELKSSPWSGVSQVYSYSNGGRAESHFSRILDSVGKTGRQDDLRNYLTEQVAQKPEWLGGQMMLALIEQKQGDKESARKKIAALVPTDEKELEKIPQQAAWIIGQELDEDEATRDLALMLYESAVKSTETSQNQIQYSVVARLVQVYQDLGRTEDAREVLLKNLRPKSVDYYDQDYQQAMLIGNKFWAAEKLQAMNQPLDSLLLFQELSSEDAGLSRAANWNGDSIDGLKRRITAGLAKSLENINQTDPDEAVERLLAVDEKRQPGEPLFDLMLTVPAVASAEANPGERISSRFGELLRKIAATGTLRANVQKRLGELQQEHPEDVSVAITRVLLAGEAEHPQALESLAQLLKQHPLDEIPEGRRPNTRQRRAALAVFPVWIVAREALRDEQQRETAQYLSEQALQGARRQVGKTETSALLMEWGRDALRSGDKAEAERRWSQLLDIVTERPTRKSAAERQTSTIDDRQSDEDFSYVIFLDEPAGKSQPAAELVPPLTMSQFNMVTRIAVEAAKAGMPDLSQRAVRELLAGGLPVPDVSTTATPSQPGMTIPSSRGTPDLQAATSEAEQLVAKSLLEIVGHWNNPAYDPHTVYELLMPVILPPARPKEILLFADSSLLDAAKFSNAGQAVIEWAARAKQLDDLAARIQQRQSTGPSEFPARILLANIALKKEHLPAAEEQLQLLHKKLQQGASDTLATLACHAALPAAERPELADIAMQIVRQAVQLRAQAAAANNNNDASIGDLQRRLLRHLASRGDRQAVADFFRDYMQARQSYYSRYGGDYGLVVQWRDWAKVSEEAAKFGAHEAAFDYLGRTADYTHRNYSRPSTGTALAAITGHVRRQPVAEQYALWRDWTLPTDSRRTVRLLVETVAPNTAPAKFLPPEQQQLRFPDRDLLSNAIELLNAAEAAGKLPELRPLVERAYQEQIANAEFLWPLLLIRMDDVETATPVLNELSKNIKARNESQENQPRADVTREYLIYQACLQSPQFGPLYAPHRRKLQDVLRSRYQQALLSRVDPDFARFRAGADDADVLPGADPRLTYWVTASTDRVPNDAVQPWWTVIENRLVHLSGQSRDTVCFRAPLQGNFEFTVDVLDDNWAEADAGYNGLVVESLATGNRTNLVAIGGHETVRLPGVLRRTRPAVHQLTIRVNDETMSYWQNNQLVYEEATSGTSPWLQLSTDRARQSSFQNPRITGQPTIPDMVALVRADRLDGWNTSFFGETQPKHRFMARKFDREADQYLLREQQREPTEFDWRATDGELHGRSLPDASADAQSWIYYHRPLQSGETFAYEFQYQPGESVAHPTLGRIAYQLTPHGVVDHWITQPEWDETICGIPADNAVVSTEFRRGPAELPLKVGDWNRVELALVDQTLSIRLNGTLIYETPAQPLPDARFGLFRLKRESATVRQLTLTGPWREQFSQVVGQDLLASTRELVPKQRRIVGQLVQENNFPSEALAVAMRARELPDDEAYALLKAWVLSSPDHDANRLYYEHLPYQSTVEIAARAQAKHPGPLDAGEVVAPAVELVNLAHRLGRLEELAREVAPSQTQSRPMRQREQAALAVLISIAAGEIETTVELMKQLDGAILAGLPNGNRPHAFAPEGLTCRVAARQPRLVLPAWELAQRLVDDSRDSKQNRAAPWKDEATDILGDVERQLIAGTPVGVSGAPQTQWRNVPYLRPNHLFDGQRPSTWHAAAGVLQHFGGLTWGQLYFQSPLRGRFEVVADRELHGYRETSISYGMYAAGPKYDYKAVEVSKVMHKKTDAKPLQELKRPEATLSGFRMTVDGQRVTTYMDGAPLHQQYMDRPPAPWLMLQASGPGYRPYVSNLRILGEPEIPDELDLLDSWGTGFWRGDYYVGQFTGENQPDNATWRPERNELIGSLVENQSGKAVEGLLRYQRPMLEDGVISFEAFYFPGEQEVHPAVGGHAFLLRPDGVQRHELTGGAYERWGRSPDNAVPIPDAAPRVPLKSNDWNSVTCQLRGDRLTISVNGREVAQHAVGEVPEERFFGLFRFANQTKARVRNIRYRGNWPKTLPTLAEQALAQGPQGILPPEQQIWMSRLDLDVNRPIAEINQGAFRVNGAAEVARPTPDGLRLSMATIDGQRKSGNITLNTLIAGDADVTLDYEQFAATQATSGWGNAAMLRCVLDDPTSSYVEVGLSLREKGQPQLRVVHRHTRLDGELRYATTSEPQLPIAGRLRLVRRGGVMYGLFAEPGSNVFRCVGSALAGSENIRRVEFIISSSDKDSTIDVVVKQMTVQSNTPAEPRTQAQR